LIFGAVNLATYAVRVFYIGTQYHGSQWQPALKTVQGKLIDALRKWSGENYSQETVQFSGRTDRGVHSISQIALIISQTELNIDKINRYLPDDIILWAFALVPEDFHPRYGILMRHYRYYLDRSNLQLDISSIRTAAQFLIGSHNFLLLSKPEQGRDTNTTILNIYVKETTTYLVIDFFGTRFLWKLIRKIVSLFRMIGTGEFSPDVIKELFEKHDVIQSGIEPAPPECLFLVDSAISLKMTTSKYALKRIKKHLINYLELLDRYFKTFSAMTEDFFSDRELLL
jgi:tRNA pseudouridine38-40 synthase